MRRWLVVVALLAGAGGAQDAGVDAWLADLCLARPNADEAFERLRGAGPQAFPKILARLLEDQSSGVKIRLATLLAGYVAAMTTTEPYAAELKRLLSEKNPEVLAALVPVFAKAGVSLLPVLERLFASPESGVRAQAGRAAGAFGAVAFPLIRKNLAAASAFRCEAALLALAEAGATAKEFAREVRPFLADKKPALRAAAASAYAATAADRREATRALLPLLDDPEPAVRQAVARSLESHATERLPELIPALASAQGEARELLTGILRRLPAGARDAYVQALLAAPSADRAALLDAMSGYVVVELDADTRARIVAWAADPNLATRAAVVRLLGRALWPDPHEALAILRAAAKAPDAELRVEALRSFAADAAMATALSSDPDPLVQMEAASVLFEAGEPGPDPLPLCIALLEQSPAAAERIGRMGARGLPAVHDLVRAAASPTGGDAARRALAVVLDTPPADAIIGRPLAVRGAPEGVAKICGRALQWLAAAQEADGRWDSVRWAGAPLCDAGLTGLAVLAFLSAGHTDVSGAHATVVRKALGFLVAKQTEDGCLSTRVTRTFLIQHAIATTALAEAACVCRWAALRPAAERGLKFISMSRNPNLGWRYDPRGGENDTFVTTWMVMALKAGEMAGLHTDRAAYEGALLWIDKMTEPNFGQVGYNYPGGQPASPKVLGATETHTPGGWRLRPQKKPNPTGLRPPFELERVGEAPARNPDRSQSCTAAGLWIRALTGSTFQTDIEMRSLGLVAEIKPTWYEPTEDIDECYWHWGALLAAQKPRPTTPEALRVPASLQVDVAFVRWRDAVVRQLIEHQVSDGSWDPVGVWGRTGGRVFSTSTAVLTLLAPYAYPEGCFTKDYRRKLYPQAYRLLGR